MPTTRRSAPTPSPPSPQSRACAASCAGIYTFTDRDAAEQYLRSDLFQGAMAANPAIANLRTRGSELLERPTRALDDALALVAGAR